MTREELRNEYNKKANITVDIVGGYIKWLENKCIDQAETINEWEQIRVEDGER